MASLRVLITGCLLVFCLRAPAQTAPTTNGLYAAFNTSKGTFYCNLRYDLTPRTVANFIGLAQGSKSWLDYPKAGLATNRPFYTNLLWHRVISNFVIQTGSPNGLGTDDPGYTFLNEISPSLNHNSAGILAMANAGGTNSNGAQFYLTLSPQPSLNGSYTVFGSVVSGLNVVTNLGIVATDANNKPLTNIYLNSVSILRIGTAASNFNINAVSPALPVPRFKTNLLTHAAGRYSINWTQSTNSEYRLLYGSDLKSWTSAYLGAYSGAYVDYFVTNAPRTFFTTIESHID